MTKALKAIPLLLALVLLASVPAVISAKTENSSGALRTTVGQVAPSVSATASPGAQVRLNSPVSVTVTFSEPVSGFTVDDITVVNGAASGFSGSGAVYTFDVTPNALDVVTVDIAAGVATDGEGNPNTAARQLSLGIPYDFDGNGGIGRAEIIAAIRDYFGGNITRAQAIAVIRLYFFTPTEPGPGPGPSGDCFQDIGTLTRSVTRTGSWTGACGSTHHDDGRYARFYAFTLDTQTAVQIDLTSSEDTYLYLLSGSDSDGTVIAENDDATGQGTNSRITETLASGTYTVEATTYWSGTTGSFNLSIDPSGTTASPPPTGNCESTVTSGPIPVQGGLGGVAITGRWVVGCDSVHRSGRNASYISFTQESSGQVIITLESSVDTYLYLLQGEGGSGTVLASNDNYGGGSNSQITRFLSPGRYTVEATTYSPSVTGEFTLTLSGITVTPVSLEAPENLTATPSGSTAIDLSWDPPSSLGGTPIRGYQIQVRRLGEVWRDVVTNTRSTATSYSHAGLTTGNRYYYRVAAIDSLGAGPWSNSADATAGAGLAGPDLIAEVTGPRNGTILEPGDSFTFSVRVRNIGDTQASSTTLRYYHSTDSRISSNDSHLDTDPVSSLASAGTDTDTDTESTRVNVPLAGTFYYYGCVDPVSGESDTSNNCSNVIVVTAEEAASGPDLIAEVTGPRNGTILEPGDSFTFSVRVRNIGDTQASSTTLRYYHSTDSRISGNDSHLDTDPVSSLASAGTDTDTESTRVNVPLAGTFYYYGCVDPVSGESDTSNNCSNVIVVTAEEAASGPDLIAEVTDPRNGTILEPGDSFTFSVRVRNIGDTQASSTTLRYYHSTDSRISSNDSHLDTDPVSSLASAGTDTDTDTESTRVNVPLAGTFYYYGCVDPVSGESDTSNNCSNVIVVTAEDAASGPDLIVSDAYIRPRSPLNPGQPFTIYVEVENIGDTRASSARLNYFITSSRTGAILASDIIGRGTVSSLSASGTGDESLGSNAPSTPGTYYYGACVNSVSGESNPDNNCSARYTLVVNQPPKPDLTAEVVSVGSDNDQYVGEEFTFSARVRNIGGASTSGSTLRFYRSTNSYISTTDIQLTTIVTGFLSSSGTRTISASSLTAPSDTGTYYYGVCVDSVSGESDTGNNCSTGRSVTVGLPYSLSNPSCTSTGFGNTRAVFSGTLRAFTALDDVKVIGYVKSGFFGLRVKIGEEDLGDLSSGSSRSFEITGGFFSAVINQQCQYEVEWDYP